jgi:hypothetical protein
VHVERVSAEVGRDDVLDSGGEGGAQDGFLVNGGGGVEGLDEGVLAGEGGGEGGNVGVGCG